MLKLHIYIDMYKIYVCTYNSIYNIIHVHIIFNIYMLIIETYRNIYTRHKHIKQNQEK